MKKLIVLLPLLAVGSAFGADYTKLHRSFYDVERAFLRYVAKANPADALPAEINPLFPSFGFSPNLSGFKWQIGEASAGTVQLCFNFAYKDEQERLDGLAALNSRGFVPATKCASFVQDTTSILGEKTVSRASIMIGNRLPAGIAVMGATLTNTNPLITLEAKTGQKSPVGSFTLYRTHNDPHWNKRDAMISSLTTSSSFEVSSYCSASKSYDICRLDVTYVNSPLDSLKFGTIGIHFDNGTYGQIGVQGFQKLTGKPSSDYLDTIQGKGKSKKIAR